MKRKTSLSLDSAILDEAKVLGINVSSVADAALEKAVAEARRAAWLAENAEAFAAQAEWHERNGHPAAKIMVGPAASSWSD
jgi:antitoxin CcdA